MEFRDNEGMATAEWVDVEEGEGLVALIELETRNFS